MKPDVEANKTIDSVLCRINLSISLFNLHEQQKSSEIVYWPGVVRTIYIVVYICYVYKIMPNVGKICYIILINFTGLSREKCRTRIKEIEYG